jgi:UDPglucose--hexose-1-phosphate uridylyltransferase
MEQAEGQRVVDENDSFLAVVPFWAVWPFETMIMAKRHSTGIDGFTDGERDGLAEILKRTTSRYDRLFHVSFPYSMGIHQRPTDGGAHAEWHVHLHFYPPLLRSATVRKFLVGYEMLATPQRDITPEAAAERLRAV